MVKINLLPVRDEAKKEIIRNQIALGVLLLALLLIVIAYFHYSISGKIEVLKAKIEENQQELNRQNKIKSKVDKFKKDSAALKRKLGVIDVLDRDRTNAVYLMDELSNVMSEELWLESLKGSKGKLVLSGVSKDHKNIADFMTNMENSKMFSGVKLKATSQSGEGKKVLHKFSVTVNFVPPEPKEK